MAVSITKLLNKKGWTGKELGRIEIANMVKIFADNKAGIINPEPIVPMEKLRSMVRSLETNAQINDYNGYIGIHRWLIDRYNNANANRITALYYITRLQHILNSSLMAQRVYDYISNLPLIMTQKQYDEAQRRHREKYLKGEDGSGEIGHSLLGLLFLAMDYYARLLQKQPDAPNPLKKVQAKYSKEKLTGKYALKNYNKMAQIGYYTLPDGRRSDEMTAEEWKEAILKNDLDADRPFNLTTSAMMRHLELKFILEKRYSSIYFSEEPEYKDRKEQLKEALKVPLKWNVSKEEPELTKWEFLTEDANLWEIYYNSDDDGKEEEALKEVLTEFKELADLLIKDIDSKYFTKDKTMAKTPRNKWLSTVFSFEELYDKDFYDFRDFSDAPEFVFDGNSRALWNGVAILKPELSFFCKCLDKDGNYKEPELSSELFTIDSLLPSYKLSAEMADRIKDDILNIKDTIYHLNGYNKAIDIIQEEFKIDIQIFKADLEYVQTQLDVLENEKIALEHSIKLSQQARGNKETDARLELLYKHFPDIKIEDNTPPQDRIEKAKELMKDYKAFTEPEEERYFYNLLLVNSPLSLKRIDL